MIIGICMFSLQCMGMGDDKIDHTLLPNDIWDSVIHYVYVDIIGKPIQSVNFSPEVVGTLPHIQPIRWHEGPFYDENPIHCIENVSLPHLHAVFGGNGYVNDTREVRVFNISQQINDIYDCPYRYFGSDNFFFDGMNAKGNAVCGVANMNINAFILFGLKQLPERASGTYRNTLSPQASWVGRITSLMIQDNDRVVCCFDRCQNGAELTGKQSKNENFGMSICEISQCRGTQEIAVIHWGKKLKKTVFLGGKKGTYLGLTDDGSLLSFWLTEDKEIAHAEQKCAYPIKDIAVDNSVKSKTGFMPHIALLAESGDLYVTDLSLPGAVLHCVGKPNVNYAGKLVYDEGNCSVIHKNSLNNTWFGMSTYPDNMSTIYTCALIKNVYRNNEQ